MPRKDFVDVLREVARKHGLEFLALSHEWIIQVRDPCSGRVCSIFGYTFDVNGAGAVEICKEKAATSLVLAQHAVPNLPHSVFLSPGHEMTGPYVKSVGNWRAIQALVETLGLPVVLKPLKGTGGIGVVKAGSWKEVEAAVQSLFAGDYGIAVSPYKEIVDEYRCICLDGNVELVYRKVRSHVLGDGVSSVATLLARHMSTAGPEDAVGYAKAAAALSPSDLARIPENGEAAPIQWKHNLGLGAGIDANVPLEMKRALGKLAIAGANAIGIHFGSVDVVDVKGEGLMIMEVNGGVMMDSLIGLLGETGREVATRIYESAVLSSLKLAAPKDDDASGAVAIKKQKT